MGKTKEIWSLSSPREGMAVTDSQGAEQVHGKQRLKSSFQRTPISRGSELTSSSQNLHPSNGWWLERCWEMYNK